MASLSVKKQNVKYSGEYKLLKNISLFMDTFFLDPILGFFVPGLGDIITASLTIPFIYTSVFKLRSVPLTLAIVYNSLIDMLVGMVPVVGNIGDIIIRSYKKNYNLIVGYVEDDPEVMSEIKSKALQTCIFITGLCIAIRLVFLALGGLVSALTPKSCTKDTDLNYSRVEQVAPAHKPSPIITESSIPSSFTRSEAAPTTEHTGEKNIYCQNLQESFSFYYGYTSYPYGDYTILSGGNGSLGTFAGCDVVSYSRLTKQYNYLCFSISPLIYSPLVIQCNPKVKKQGTCMADTEFTTEYAYYSGSTNSKVEPEIYSAVIGNYPIVIELALDRYSPIIVGTYYYKKNGPNNRMIVHGEKKGDDSLVLWAYDPDISDEDTEVMYLTRSLDRISGEWKSQNGKKLEMYGNIQ